MPPVRLRPVVRQNRVKKSTGSWFRTILEFSLFVGWLVCTGVAGYLVGNMPSSQECPPSTTPPQPPPQPIAMNKPMCAHDTKGSGIAAGAVIKPEGYSLDELKRLWKCSHAQGNATQVNKKLYPKENNYDKTKWKSILAVEPKAFFDKYLSQYPQDIRAVQPVIVFSHKPLDHFKDISEVCKVIDVAIVPDTPGVCVAVTETFHDVASYHMLHADKQVDGTFALTSNTVEGRHLPEEKDYKAARGLLLEYFEHVEYVANAVRDAPRYGQNKVAVGCLAENLGDVLLFKNSLASAVKAGVSKSKFCLFTTSEEVKQATQSLGVKVIHLPAIAAVGTQGDGTVSSPMRRHFLQAWLAFAVANNQNKMLWQAPGTVWLDRPDNIVNISPIVETLWSFRGRKDSRAAPFFCSFDFFIVSGAERPVHLMHEVLLHFDLVLAWGSLDAVAAYRLSENNARYGTTTHILPPFKVLHTELMNSDAEKIKAAATAADHPMVVVIPNEGAADGVVEKLLRDSGLWFMES